MHFYIVLSCFVVSTAYIVMVIDSSRIGNVQVYLNPISTALILLFVAYSVIAQNHHRLPCYYY